MFVIGDENVYLFLNGVKGRNLNFCIISPYLVTYHWNGLLTRNIEVFLKGFHNIPTQKGRNIVIPNKTIKNSII